MRTFILDGETFYSDQYTLRNMSPAEYILDPRFEMIGLAVKELNIDKTQWIEGPQVGAFLNSLDPANTTTISHNALFDNCIWSYRYNWVPARMICTLGMARSQLNIRQNSLAAVATYLGIGKKGDEIKLAKGMKLADLKARREFYPHYVNYAINDARLCEAVYLKLINSFPEEEIQIQDLVLRAAVEPVLHADIPLLESHLDTIRKKKARLLRECDYDKACLMSTKQFQAALEELGVVVQLKISPTGRQIPAFAKSDDFMAGLLEYNGSANDDVNFKVQVLAAARLQHKSTIEETRAERFLNIAKLPWGAPYSCNVGVGKVARCEPMMPVPLRYGGAHTHRLAGEWKMNLQNLPRDKTKSNLRRALIAPPGHKLITADLAQIEARIVARICEQKDLLVQFARGEDVYATFASYIFNREVNKLDNPNERWMGKTAILGLGYGCGKDRFNQMVLTDARKFSINLSEIYDGLDTADKTVNLYRTAFTRISRSWRQLDNMLATILNNTNKNQRASFGPVWILSGRILLPNKMYLRYDIPDHNLYGAKLLENIVQALARIILMQAALRLAERGYRFALQAHDELLFVVPDSEVEYASEVIREEMLKEPDWLQVLPLEAEIGVGQNYGEAK